MLYKEDGRIMLWLAEALSVLGNKVDASVRKAADTKYGDDQLLAEEALAPWLKMQNEDTYSFHNTVLGWEDSSCCPDSIATNTKDRLTFDDLDDLGRAASMLFEKVSYLERMCEHSIPNAKLVEKQLFDDNGHTFIETIKALGGLAEVKGE